MKVFINEYIDPAAYERLKSKVELSSDLDCMEEYDALLIKKQVITREMIAKARKCKIIARHGVGCDMIDLEAAREYGIPVVNIPGVNAESVAELAVAFMFALAKKIKYYDKGLQNGIFPPGYSPLNIGCELEGKTVALVGTGHIAQKVSKIMKGAFDAKVLAYSPNLTDAKAEQFGWIKYSDLCQMLGEADIVNVSVPLTDLTKGMIGKKELACMKKTAMLVNTARGGVVDEQALYECLSKEQIWGAASDVFETEPPQKDNPLLTLDNFIATAHIGSSTYESMKRCGNIVVDNIFKALNIE